VDYGIFSELRREGNSREMTFSLKFLYLCPSVMGLLQTSGLQSTHDSDKSQAVNPRQY
jgi:hypothetical protein